MTREEFVKKFEVLKEHNDQAMAIGDALGKHLLDGAPVVAYGGFLEQHYIELLAELSGITKEMISALLYEGPSMHYYGEQSNGHHAIEVNVVTAEDLWDFYQLCDEYDETKKQKQVLLYDEPTMCMRAEYPCTPDEAFYPQDKPKNDK